MTEITVSRDIRAPVETVFRAITDIAKLPESIPDIVRIEFLGERRSGAGTRFRETRSMMGKEMRTELELTEVVDNERARFVSDMGGAIWDTVFRLRPRGSPPGSETHLEVALDARPYKLQAKLMIPAVRGMVSRSMEQQIDSLRAYCEAQGGRV